MKRSAITAAMVRRVLLALAADEVRIAQEARDDAPPPVTIATLREHAGAHAFCRSLAREADKDNNRVLAAEQRITTHLRARRDIRRRS